MEFTIDYIKENLDFWVNENLLSPSEFEFSKILEANLQDENVDFFYKIFQFWDSRQDRLSCFGVYRWQSCSAYGIQHGS